MSKKRDGRLIHAATNGDLGRVKELLDEGADADATGNLREVDGATDFDATDALITPAADAFCAALHAVAAVYPELGPKSADLQRHVRRFTESLSTTPDDAFDEDLPF